MYQCNQCQMSEEMIDADNWDMDSAPGTQELSIKK